MNELAIESSEKAVHIVMVHGVNMNDVYVHEAPIVAAHPTRLISANETHSVRSQLRRGNRDLRINKPSF